MKTYSLSIFFTLALIMGLTDLPPAAAQTGSPLIIRSYLPPPRADFDRIRLINVTDSTATGCAPGALGMKTDGTTVLICNNSGLWQPPDAAASGGEAWKKTDDFIELNPEALPASKLIGIGTDDPRFKLSLDNDGGILAAGQAHTNLPQDLAPAAAQGAGTKFMWHSKNAGLHVGYFDTTPLYSLGGDRSNWTAANSAGFSSGANQAGSLTFSGFGNSGYALSGRENATAVKDNQLIGGGLFNKMKDAAGAEGIILGGSHNSFDATLTGTLTHFIGGGAIDTWNGTNPWTDATLETDLVSAASFAQINNVIAGSATDGGVIGGGTRNYLSSTTSIIVGGKQNRIDWEGQSPTSTIIGGYNNIIRSNFGFIGGGGGNFADDNPIATWASIGGGSGNSISRTLGTIIGGQNNQANGTGAVVAGGEGNICGSDTTSTNDYCAISGGQNNTIGHSSYIGGGISNTINRTNTYDLGINNVVFEGQNNQIFGAYNIILGGSSNKIGTTVYDIGLTPNSGILGGSAVDIQNAYGNSFAMGSNLSVQASKVFAWAEGAASNDPIVVDQNNSFSLFKSYSTSSNQWKSSYPRVGIGVVNPRSRLHVNGNVRLGGAVRIAAQDMGSVKHLRLDPSTEEVKECTNCDFAEIFDTSEPVTPGDVIIIDTSAPNKFKRSVSPYDRRVVGIVSTAPALVLKGTETIISPNPNSFTDPLAPPVALTGQVPCKVTLENGPIAAGDLLTTSSVPGHAMRAERDLDTSFGRVIGKALEGFAGGPNGETEGKIQVFVTHL